MKPLLFRFKTALNDPSKNENLFYDDEEEIVRLGDRRADFVINSTKSFVLGTKKAKVDGGEDQKATLFSNYNQFY